jgi:hypothetical protein
LFYLKLFIYEPKLLKNVRRGHSDPALARDLSACLLQAGLLTGGISLNVNNNKSLLPSGHRTGRHFIPRKDMMGAFFRSL